jgi:hypothetical protein
MRMTAPTAYSLTAKLSSLNWSQPHAGANGPGLVRYVVRRIGAASLWTVASNSMKFGPVTGLVGTNVEIVAGRVKKLVKIEV